MAEAEEQLGLGLAIADAGSGFRYHVLHEFAVHYAGTARIDEAIETAEQASGLVPQHHANWALLARLYERKHPECRSQAAHAARQAKRLASDKNAAGVVVRALPECFIYGTGFMPGRGGIEFTRA